MTDPADELLEHYLEGREEGAVYIKKYIKDVLVKCIHFNGSAEDVAKEVTDTFSRLLCAGKPPEQELPRLKAILGSSGPCGKTLSNGEPTFTCSDCALDPTCVMCMECYNASVHCAENHNLEVHTSLGCGMCDCGDEEAWTSGATCSIHKKTLDDETPIDEKLPPNIQRVAYDLFKEIMRLSVRCFRELPDDDKYMIPDNMIPKPDEFQYDISDRFVTVVFNDELHNFDEVIQQFKELMGSSQSEGSKYATSIDREGRMLLRKNTERDAIELRDKFLSYKPKNTSSRHTFNQQPLVTRAMPEFDYVLQDLLIEVLLWISDICQANPAFRRILCKVSLEDDPHSLIWQIMVSDVMYWKKVKSAWHKIFMSSYFIDAVYKKIVAILFVENYSEMLSAFLYDDKKHDFNYSIISLTVQLFTVPSISTILMSEHKALNVIFDQYVKFYKPYVECDKDISRIKMVNQNTGYIDKRRERMFHIIKDTKYILANIPENFTPKIEEEFLDFFKLYVEFNGYLQEMNPYIRKSGNHIPREKEWNHYFVLEICEIKEISSFVAKWCVKTERLFKESTRILLDLHERYSKTVETKQLSVTSYDALSSLVNTFGGGANTAPWEKQHKAMKNQLLFPEQINYVKHDMFKDEVSFHIPATRLLATILSEINTPERYEYVRDLLKSPKCAILLDVTLRTILLCQQIEALMWKRNGLAMEHQMRCYRESYKAFLWDKDLLSLQVILPFMSPDEALLRIIHKYKIEPYFAFLSSESEDFEPLIKMAESFAFLMLNVLAERFKVGLSDATEEEVYTKDLIHTFSLANIPRSKALRSLTSAFTNFDNYQSRDNVVNDLLQKLTTQIHIDVGVSVNLKLKPEYETEFTPFYYHYSAEQRQVAERKYTQRFINNPNFDFKPPYLPKLIFPYSNLRSYLLSPILQRFMYVVLARYVKTSGGAMVSDLLLHQVIFLIMSGVQDQKLFPDDSADKKFSDMIMSCDNPAYLVPEEKQQSIVSLLKQLYPLPLRCVKEIKPIIKWILDATEFLESGSPAEEPMAMETTASDIQEPPTDERKERSKRARLNLLKKFQTEQAAFLLQNAEIFDNITDDAMVEETDETVESENCVVCGPNKGPFPKAEVLSQTCILCKEAENVSPGKSAMIYGCLVEKSVVLKPETHDDIDSTYRISHLFNKGNLHIQSCGHPMHYDCLKSIVGNGFNIINVQYQFLAGVVSRYRFHKGEFSCPLCKMSANCVLPVTPFDDINIPDCTTLEFLNDIDTSLSTDEEIRALPEEEMMIDSDPEPEPALRLDRTLGLEELIDLGREELDDDDAGADTFMFEYNSVATNDENRDPDASESNKEPVSAEEKFKEDMRRFYRRVKHILNPKESAFKCSAPYTVKMVSYTFSMLEFILREKPLMDGLAEYQEDFLHTLLKILYRSLAISDHLYSQELSHELMYLFSTLKNKSHDIPSILNLDVFTVFVASNFGIYLEGKCYNNALVELCVIAELIKILLSIENVEMGTDASADDGDAIQLAMVWGYLRKLSGISDNDDPYPCPTYLLHTVKSSLLPLLRKMALFLRYLTGIPSPVALKEMQSKQGEFMLLLKYLNLESLSFLLQFDKLQELQILNKWCETVDVPRFKASVSFNASKREGKLIDLPENFVDLLFRASKYVCPKVKVQARNVQSTALCLVCGNFTCFYNYCCQGTIDGIVVGPGNLHAHNCSGDLGVFLNFEKCQVFFLPLKSTGIYVSGPYLDKYGENYKSSRNKALTLSNTVYKKIEKMWVKHEIRPLHARNNETMLYPRNLDGLMY